MDCDIPVGVKRKSTSENQIKSSKRKRIESYINILDLSDCTLLYILKFLDATSLYMLGETCTRFKQLVQDESLWIYADGRSKPNVDPKIQFCWDNLHKRTKALLMAGGNRSDFILSLHTFFDAKKLSNLTILALEHQCIKYCYLREFPSTLEELSLRHSFVPRHSDFFRFSQEGMVNLKTLILDHCQWLEADSLISFSRLPKLEILSLYMCKKLGDDDISDVSLAGKFGFKTLKVIDLRFTGLGENFLKTFYKSSSLQCIYFQCFPSTYQLERLQRKLDIIKGKKMNENSYMSDDEFNNDISRHSFKKRFNASKLITADSRTINDETMLIFNCLKPREERKVRPKSYLYVYPYGECTCGFFDKESGTYGPVDALRQDKEEEVQDNPPVSAENLKSEDKAHSPSSTDDEDDWDATSLHKKLVCEKHKLPRRKCKDILFMQPNTSRICRRITFDSCTSPDWCQVQSHPEKCYHKWLYAREPRNDFEISMLEHTDKHYKIRAIRSCGKKNIDCECGDSCDEEGVSVIVVARTNEGRVVHYRPTRNRSSHSVEVQLTESTDAEITQLIDRLTELFTNFDRSCVHDVLMAIYECSKFKEFSKMIDVLNLMEDKEFTDALYENFFNLSKALGDNCKRILSYHSGCFGNMLQYLLRHEHMDTKKHILQLFFRNLLNSVNSTEFIEQPATKDQTLPTEENWNQPGPSGLQSSHHTFTLENNTQNNNNTSTNTNNTEADTNNASTDTNNTGTDINNTGTDTNNTGTDINNTGTDTNNTSTDTNNTGTNTNNSGVNTKESRRANKIVIGNLSNRSLFIDRRASNLRSLDEMRNLRRADNVERDNASSFRSSFLTISPQVNIYFETTATQQQIFVRMAEEPRDRRNENNIVLQALPRDIPTNIKELSLRGYLVTDKTLVSLKEMDLDLLDITHTKVTVAGVEQFMMSNPQCRLIHESTCVCRPKLHF